MRILSVAGALVVAILFFFGSFGAEAKSRGDGGGGSAFDCDPTVDLALKVTILEVWEVDKVDSDKPGRVHNPADFYWTVKIESVFWKDPKYSGSATSIQTAWVDQDHIKPMWSFTQDIDDWNARAWINITLYDDDGSGDDVCDISPDPGRGTLANPEGGNAEIYYGVDYGRPMTDDADRDSNGVWHLSGTQDGSYATDEDDCELWYSVTQVDKTTGKDKDGDGIPWYMEDKVYGTSPTVNNMGQDFNGDGITIEYEERYGLSVKAGQPNYVLGDYDYDGLTLQEEYRWRGYGCAPDYPDALVEIDYKVGHIPEEPALDSVRDVFMNHRTTSAYVGVRVTLVVDQMVPSAVIDPGNRDSSDTYRIVKADYFDINARGGAWRYCLVTYEYNYFDVVERRWVYEEGICGWAVDDIFNSDDIYIFDGAIDTAIDRYNSAPLRGLDVERWEGVALCLIHELAHTMGIGVPDANGVGEHYCDEEPIFPGFGDVNCAMAYFQLGYNLDDQLINPHLCEAHWATMDWNFGTGLSNTLDPY